jgi:WD40 repeat protein/tRNA A-37 threonylcarbamoyl transferase component Bud32
MNGDRGRIDSRESRLDALIAEYLEAAEAGRAPDREQFLASHPDLAADLAEFLDNRDRIQELVGPRADKTESHPRTCSSCGGPLEGKEGSTCPHCGQEIPLAPANVPSPVLHRVGRIELSEVIGRGAFGTVYKGWDPQIQRWVAVKVLRTDPLLPPDTNARFLREARVQGQLDHPGVVRVHDVGLADGIPYMVSEFVPGRTLAGLIRDDRPGPDQAAEVVAAVADALHHAHQKQVVHRDVKSSNILLKDDRVPLLTDFGLAHWDIGEATLTEDGRIIGTLPYMSPQSARGQARADPRCDVYSLGVVLYELLTGVLPFTGNVRGLLYQIEHDDPRPPRALDDRIPRDLQTICLKCLEKKPERRYPSARELADDLRRFLDRKPIRARPVSPLRRLVRWGQRNPTLATAVGLTAALLAATAGVSVAWAVHADHQAGLIRTALEEARKVTAETELDRGLAEAERGDVGAGLLWLARALETVPDSAVDLQWCIRVNLSAWRRQRVALTDCLDSPPGTVRAFSPDGRSAWFVAPGGRTVRCWDLVSARVAGPEFLEAPAREKGPPLDPSSSGGMVDSVAVSPDGSRVACVGSGLGVRVWDARDGRLLSSLTPDGQVRGVAWLPDGRRLLLGIDEKGKPGTALYEWDSQDLRPAGVALGTQAYLAVAAGSDGRTVVTAGLPDSEFRCWDLADGRVRERVIPLPAPIRAVALSPDGRRVLTGGDDRAARLWDLASGRLLAVLRHPGPVSAVSFGQDGRVLRTASPGDAIRVWKCPEEDGASSQAHPGAVRALAVSPDGSLVATGSDDRQVRLWSTAGGKWAPVGQPLPHPKPIWTVAFSPDGKVLATTTYVFGIPLTPCVRLWDLGSGQPPVLLNHRGPVHQVAFSPDSRLLATTGADGDVWLWDTKTGQLALPNPLRHGQTVLAVAFSLDGRTVVTGGRDRMARRWEVLTGAPLGEPLPHDGPVRLVAFHPSDPELLLTAGEEGNARLWNTKTEELLRRLPHGFPVWTATFSPDGQAVLTGGEDGTARVWEIATGQEVKPTLRHGGWVRAVATSPSGRWAATASDDGTARLWSLRTGRSIGPPVRHLGGAFCAVIDPGDRWVVTAGRDRAARLLSAPTEFGGLPERSTLWAQVEAGTELGPGGDLRPLDAATWRQRRADFRDFDDGAP